MAIDPVITVRVSTELAEMLRQPGGYRSRGPVTFWLDGEVLTCRELTEAEQLADHERIAHGHGQESDRP